MVLLLNVYCVKFFVKVECNDFQKVNDIFVNFVLHVHYMKITVLLLVEYFIINMPSVCHAFLLVHALSSLASVRRPRTLIAIWTFVSFCARASEPCFFEDTCKICFSVYLLKTKITNLYPSMMYLLSNITWMGTPDTCALSIFQSRHVFMIDGEFYSNEWQFTSYAT